MNDVSSSTAIQANALGFKPSLLLLAVVAGSLLVACNEPSKQTDFSPEADRSGDAPGTAGIAASELVYDQRKVPLVAGGKCNLERANGKLFAGTPLEVPKGSLLTYVGWVANTDAMSIPASVDLRFVAGDSRVWKATVQPGLARADVAALLGGDPAYAKPGFSATINIGSMPAGAYRSYIVFQDGEVLRSCDNGRAISIVQ